MALFNLNFGHLNTSSEYLTTAGEKVSWEVPSKNAKKGVNTHEKDTQFTLPEVNHN